MIEKIIENQSLHNFLDGITAGVIGLIAVTAVKFFSDTIIDIFTLLIFTTMLFFLYKVKSKFAVLFVILISGIAGFIYNSIQ